MNDQAIEQEIQAKGLTAARITPADIEANIVGEFYFNPSDYTIGCGHGIGSFDSGKVKRHTFCILTLTNGFTVVGVNEGPVSAANFDAELGRKLARQKAVDQLWPLMGYELKSRLAGPTQEQVSRFLTWPVPAHVYPDGAPGQPGRTGTNLLDAPTAQEMLQHVLRA